MFSNSILIGSFRFHLLFFGLGNLHKIGTLLEINGLMSFVNTLKAFYVFSKNTTFFCGKGPLAMTEWFAVACRVVVTGAYSIVNLLCWLRVFWSKHASQTLKVLIRKIGLKLQQFFYIRISKDYNNIIKVQCKPKVE